LRRTETESSDEYGSEDDVPQPKTRSQKTKGKKGADKKKEKKTEEPAA